MERLIDAGVDGIFTDRIDILKDLLEPWICWTGGLASGPVTTSSETAAGRAGSTRSAGRAVLRLGAVGLGVVGLQRDVVIVRLRALPDRRGRPRRRARTRCRARPGWASRRALAGLLIAADRPGDRPARRRRRTPQAQPGHLDRRWSSPPCSGCSSSATSPAYLWLGLVLLAAGAVFHGVRRRLLQRDAAPGLHPGTRSAGSPASAGRCGYLGGIVVLLVGYVCFIAPDVGLFGVTAEGGLQLSGCWRWWSPSGSRVFAIPVLLAVPEMPPDPTSPRVELLRLVPAADRRRARPCSARDRHAVWFLIACAALPRRAGRGLQPSAPCWPSACTASARRHRASSSASRPTWSPRSARLSRGRDRGPDRPQDRSS